jgi:hypothetical protein
MEDHENVMKALIRVRRPSCFFWLAWDGMGGEEERKGGGVGCGGFVCVVFLVLVVVVVVGGCGLERGEGKVVGG